MAVHPLAPACGSSWYDGKIARILAAAAALGPASTPSAHSLFPLLLLSVPCPFFLFYPAFSSCLSIPAAVSCNGGKCALLCAGLLSCRLLPPGFAINSTCTFGSKAPGSGAGLSKAGPQLPQRGRRRQDGLRHQ
jgi:hypothetical protein